jgi:photosystem II stability/assembly factor-like uncharacterized protein
MKPSTPKPELLSSTYRQKAVFTGFQRSSYRSSVAFLATSAWIVTLMVGSGVLAVVEAQTWENLGPKNEAGCMTGLFLHSESNKLFASSPDGGLWRADITSTTISWTPISDFLDNMEIRAFGVAPSNSEVIYVANKSNSLYKTTDGGLNWTRLDKFNKSFGRANKILVRHDSAGWVYVGTTSGLFRSSDSGESWVQPRASEDVLDIAMDREDSRILYIGVRGKGVFKTTDRGTNWTQVLNWTQTRSTNNSWVPPKIYPSEMIKIALGETGHDGTDETPQTRTVVVKLGKQIHISQSAGATFVDKSATIITDNDSGYYTRTESLVKGEWENAIAVDPFDSNHIMVGQDSLFNTTDLGDNWLVVNNREMHTDMQAIQFHRTTRNLVFLANDGGVERSTTATPLFNPIYSNLITAQLLRVGIAGDLAVGNSDHNSVIGTRTLASGQWEEARPRNCGYGNNNMERMGVYADKKRHNRFYIFHDTHIARLIFPNSSSDPCDRRATMFSDFVPYIVSPSPERPQQGIAVDTRSDSQLLLACADGVKFDGDEIVRSDCTDTCSNAANTSFRLKLTRNGDIEPTGTFVRDDPDSVGNLPTWETTAESLGDPFVSVSFSPRNTGIAFAITKSGALFTTSFPLPLPTTGNWTWTSQNGWVGRNNGDGVRHMAIHPSNDNCVYAITENTLAKTSNKGATWSTILRNIPTQKYYSIVATGQNLFLGTSDGVYKTANEGTTWKKKNGNLPNVKVVQLVIDGNYLYAVTFGRGLWRIPLSQLYDVLGNTESSRQRFGTSLWFENIVGYAATADFVEYNSGMSRHGYWAPPIP